MGGGICGRTNLVGSKSEGSIYLVSRSCSRAVRGPGTLAHLQFLQVNFIVIYPYSDAFHGFDGRWALYIR